MKIGKYISTKIIVNLEKRFAKWNTRMREAVPDTDFVDEKRLLATKQTLDLLEGVRRNMIKRVERPD